MEGILFVVITNISLKIEIKQSLPLCRLEP